MKKIFSIAIFLVAVTFSVFAQSTTPRTGTSAGKDNTYRILTYKYVAPNKDPGGIATDSLAFVEIIPECTNLSVGYYYAHSKSETQDVTFLGELAEALLS